MLDIDMDKDRSNLALWTGGPKLYSLQLKRPLHKL